MMKRRKPNHADFYNWDEFVKYADEEGLGVIGEDWVAWWECWVRAYKTAMI